MPDDLRPDEKQRQAAALHIAGLTYREIQERLGYESVSSAFEAVKVGLRTDLEDSKSELVHLELRRLDVMFMGVWPDARKGRVVAIDRALKIMERRAKYLGLDNADMGADTKPGTQPVSEVAQQRLKREQRRKAAGA